MVTDNGVVFMRPQVVCSTTSDGEVILNFSSIVLKVGLTDALKIREGLDRCIEHLRGEGDTCSRCGAKEHYNMSILKCKGCGEWFCHGHRDHICNGGVGKA